ncbi:CvpA family protein [Maridesulfovibrio bastinii]|jgi:membrane protein required for colicin V production|uniref:CvpA family protein n=1 Tax=Maridesulfovibrio bastinii TaxID=47157 RepID=UPI000400E276|nr:CvpA family protein [Maridesulfovibrio bastinii]
MTTEGMALNALDIILIVIAGGLIFRGLLRGIIREAFSMVSLALGFYLAATYHSDLEPYFARFFDGPGTVKAVSYVSIILATIIVAVIITKLLQKLLTISMLGWADQLLGGILGFAEAILVGGIIVITLSSFTPNSDFLKKSKLAPRVLTAATFIISFAPDDVLDSLNIDSILPNNSPFS